MSLRKRVILIAGVAALALNAFLFLLARGVIQSRLVELEKAEAQENVTRVKFLVQRLAEDLWLHTDLVLANLGDLPREPGERRGFLERLDEASNAGRRGFDLALLTDPAGEAAVSLSVPTDGGSATTVSERLRHLLLSEVPWENLDEGAGVAGFLALDGRPAAVAVLGPHASDGSEREKASVLFVVRHLDGGLLQRIRGESGLDVEWRLFTDAWKSPEFRDGLTRFDTERDILVLPDPKGPAIGYGLIEALDGAPLLALRVPVLSSRYDRARLSLVGFITFLIVCNLALGVLVMVVLIERFVVGRVSTLIREVRRVGASRDTSERVKVEGRDELSDLARQINDMLAALEGADLARRASEKLLSDTFDAIQEGICVMDRDHNVLRVNSWVERMYPDSVPLVGRKCHQSFQRRDAPCETCPAVLAIESGETQRGVAPYAGPDGRTGWLDLTAFPVKDADGRVTGVIECASDVTREREAEAALRTACERSREIERIVNRSPAVVFLWRVGEERSVEYVSENVGRFGYRADDFHTGKVDLADLIHPEDRARVEAERAEFAASGEGDRQVMEYRVVTASGEPRLVEDQTWLRRDENGAVTHLQGILIDVTDRQAAQEELNRIRAAVDDATDAVVVLDIEGRVTYMNLAFAEALQHTPESINEDGVRTIFVDEATASDVLAAVQCYSHWEGEAVLRSREGRSFPVYLRASPILDERVEAVGALFVINDITDRKRLERQLLQAQKLESIGQLAAGIAHEINTPTQYIGDNARFLREGFDDVVGLLDRFARLLHAVRAGGVSPDLLAEVEEAVEEADIGYLVKEIPEAIRQSLEGIEHVAQIVRAMKEFSHPGVEEMTSVNINRAVESTVTVARNEWKYVAEVETRLDETAPDVLCQPGELNQVLLNLIINASQAIAEVVGENPERKGRIVISTGWDETGVEARVSDTGGGIPEEIRDKIFDPFFTTKEVGRGSGQGLAISHDVIVDKYGGSLTFESEVNKGTTFVVRLPLSEPMSETTVGSDEATNPLR